jgi:predicted ATP-grasp superfamily ATP-dependent carboligase
VLVKPSSTEGFKRRFSRQNFRCETGDEVERAYADTEPFEPIVQELVPGGDEELYTVGSYLRADGEPLGVFSGRKLLQTPPGIGTCRVGEAVWVDEAVDAGLRFLHGLEFHGLSQVEFKRDPRDGAFRLMEVNPRLWQWHGLASASGVDLPRIAYADLVGEPAPPAPQNGRRKRWAITFVPGEGTAFQRPPYVEAVLARDDLKPALVQVARLLRSVRR